MRKLAPIVVCLLVIIIALPAVGKTGFSGTYSVRGTNPGVGAYTGTLTITPRGDVYDVAWVIGKAAYYGVGVASGDGLAVAYTGSDRSWIGVMSYRQKADGSLEGRWAVVGGNTKPGTETATRK